MGDSLLTEEQIASIKEIFSLFDRDNDGVVEIKHLGMMVRGLNQYPTEEEVKHLAEEIDPQAAGYFDFPEFLSLMARNMKDVDTEEELYAAFKALIGDDEPNKNESKQTTNLIKQRVVEVSLKAGAEKLNEHEQAILKEVLEFIAADKDRSNEEKSDESKYINYHKLARFLVQSYKGS